MSTIQMNRILALAALPTLLAACGGDAGAAAGPPAGPPFAELREIPAPAGPGSGEPNLVRGADGVVYLSWLEPTSDGRHALRFSRLEDGQWSEPRTIIDRDGLFVNWADFPSLAALEDGTLAAHWLEKSGPATYAYDVRMAVSRDGGATWSDDIIPHRDGVQAEHGFVSLVPLDGGVGAVWLDGRETVNGQPMTLRTATIMPDGRIGDGALLDSSTCDCCQTAAAMAAAGPVVAYRDRSEAEVRDISITRRVDGEWTAPRAVHEDGWVINACPVNGPAVVADGDRVTVAWFTAAQDDPRVLVAFSDDGGASFAPPVRADDGDPMGRVGLASLEDSVLLTWLERSGTGAEVRARRVSPAGAGPSAAVTATAAERASGFPRLVRAGDSLVFAWTRTGEQGGVRTAITGVGSGTGSEGT